MIIITKAPKPPSVWLGSWNSIAINNVRIEPIIIRIIPITFRIFGGIKSRINSNNKFPILGRLLLIIMPSHLWPPVFKIDPSIRNLWHNNPYGFYCQSHGPPIHPPVIGRVPIDSHTSHRGKGVTHRLTHESQGA